MSALELRCQLLLRAYPPGYREDRGDEIVGTLLEATPDGRTWPLRPGTAWLWPLGVVALAPWLHGPGQPVLIAIGIVSICWIIVVDAKLALAGAAFLLAAGLSSVLTIPGSPVIASERILIVLGFVVTVGALALWRLRRQSAR
jgi:hypothetical protein